MDGDSQSSGADWRDLQERFSALKTEGCGFLVTGAVPEEIRARHCRDVMGKDDSAPRRRLLILTDTPSPASTTRVPTPNHPATETTLIDHTVFSRTTATQATVPTQPSIDRQQRVAVEELAEVGYEVVDAVTEFETEAHEPGTLRICLDSLAPYVSEYDHDSVFKFLHLLLGTTRNERGMLYVYLPKPRESEIARTVAPLFDGVVSHRLDGDHPQQRWDIRDGPTTEWFPL